MSGFLLMTAIKVGFPGFKDNPWAIIPGLPSSSITLLRISPVPVDVLPDVKIILASFSAVITAFLIKFHYCSNYKTTLR